MSEKGEKQDFCDPLGVNEQPACELEDEIDDTDFELVKGGKEISDGEEDIDKYFLQNQKSSMANLALDDDLEDDSKDLFVVVDNPEKHESYITYRVVTKTSRSEFDNTEYRVRRRYNDFVWLRERLEHSQPTLLVPPLPEKHSMSRFDRFNQEFVKIRRLALQKFLQRLADHPVLSFNRYFSTFLTAKQSEFQAAKKEGAGLFSRVADSFHNISASYMMKNRADDFTDMTEYVQTFGEKLGVMDRISARILKEHYDYMAGLNEWGPVFTLWSNSEERLSQALQAVAKAVENNYRALQEMYDATEAEFSQPLREYILYNEAVKAVLRRRDAIQMEYEITLEELSRKKEEKEQVRNQQTDEATIKGGATAKSQIFSLSAMMGKNTEEAIQLKTDRLEDTIDELSQQVEQLQDKSTCADSDLKADMERWHKTKKKDFKRLFMDMCDRQIRYYEKCLKAWEDTIPLIQKTDSIVIGGSHAEHSPTLNQSPESPAPPSSSSS